MTIQKMIKCKKDIAILHTECYYNKAFMPRSASG